MEPRGGVIRLSTPTSLEAVKVDRLLVDVGDRLEAGQLVAILDGYDRLQADLQETRSAARIAEARLTQVLAGEEVGDIDAQRAEIARLEAELSNAQAEYQRYEALYENGAISTSELDSKRLIMATTSAQLDQARASLSSVARVRPEDVAVAEAELENARDKVARAEAEMELAYVRSPLNAEVLAVHTRAGEALSPNGIIDLGQTEQMSVVAEVDQTYIDVVEIGQPVTVSSSLFEGELRGEVERISSLIGKNDLLDTDPAADEDSRVVEVRIILDEEDSAKVARLSNLQVDVSIDITSTSAESTSFEPLTSEPTS